MAAKPKPEPQEVLRNDIAARQLQTHLPRQLDAEQTLKALEAAGLAYWEWDLDANETRYSARWETLLGFPLEALNQDYPSWDLLLHPDDSARVRAALEEHLQRRTVHYDVEARFKTASGDYRWMLIRGRLAPGGQGGLRLLIGSLTDISRRKLNELALQRSTDLIAAVQALQQRFIQHPGLDSLGIEILTTLLKFSGCACGCLAEVETDDQQQSQLALVAAGIQHSPSESLTALPTATAATHPAIQELSSRLSDGDLLEPTKLTFGGDNPASSYLAIPIRDGAKLIGLIVLGEGQSGDCDATLQMIQPVVSALAVMIAAARAERERAARAEDLVRVSMIAIDAERRLRQITDGLPGVVFQFEFGRDGNDRLPRFNFVSRGITALTGLTAVVVTASPRAFLRRVCSGDRRKVVFALLRCRQSQATIQLNFRIRDANGNTRWLEATANRPEGATDSRIWNGFLFDITERKRADVELQRAKDSADAANRAKSSFLATVSHEIRTPLHGALGLVEMLKLSKLDTQQQTNVQLIEESGRSLLRLIDDLLDFSRMERGVLEIQGERAELRQNLVRIVEFWQETARLKNLKLNLTVAQNVPKVTIVDRLRLKQILDNLISNAIKFTSQGHVDVVVVAEPRTGGDPDTMQVHFQVIDTGIGVAPATQARLFQPFVQGESDTTRRFGGTGLGLSICRGLAERMGGSIAMRSTPGVGTEVTLELPLRNLKTLPQAAEPPPTTSIAAPEAAAANHGAKILVAEDHAVNRILIDQQLRRLGYHAEFATNGNEALALWRTRPFDIILTDCHMPEMDGFDLARAIRDEERRNGQPQIPIVAFTADVYAGIVEACTNAGMTARVDKPITLDILRTTLERWLPSAALATTPTEPAPSLLEPTTTATAAAAPLLDRNRLLSLTRNNEALADMLLQTFLKSLSKDYDDLCAALDHPEPETLQRAAHRLLGSARSVCAMRLAALAEIIQNHARHRDIAHAVAAAAELSMLVDATRNAILTSEAA